MKGCFVFCAAFFTFAVVSVAGMRARNPDPRAGWRLVPVVVAAVDLTEGSAVTMEEISQRSIPEQFASEAYVTPEFASVVINRRITFPLLAGDPLTWSAFADFSRHAAVQDCATASKPAVDEVGSSALASVVEELKVTTPPEVSPIPPPVADADGFVEVVTAARDLSPGVIGSADVQVTKVPARFVTASWVPGSERASLVGARLLVGVQARDGVWWQMLDDAKHPATAAGCAEAVEGAQAAKTKAIADVQAAQWFEAHPTKEAP